MALPDNTTPARNFVRSLNVVTRQASLYGLQHKLVASQFEFSFDELQKALVQRDRLMLVPAADRLLLDGTPLNCGSAEKSLSQLFVAAGVAALSILPSITKEEFASFVNVLGRTKPADIFAQLRGDGTPRSVHPIAFAEIGEASSKPDVPQTAFGSEIVFALLGVDATTVRTSIDTPEKLLQLVSATEGGQNTVPAFGYESLRESPPLQEDDVARVIRWLGRSDANGGAEGPDDNRTSEASGAKDLAVALQEPAESPELSPMTKLELRKALSAALSQANDGMEQSLLVSLAEHLAIRASLRKFESGDASYNAVQQLLDRLKHDIEGLRELVHEHDVPGREAWAEALDRKFWESVPAHRKSGILSSQGAWCVPVANVRSYLTELIAKGDEPQCDNILRNYCRQLNSPEPGAAEKVAAGLVKLTDLYARHADLLEWTLRKILESIPRCPDESEPHLVNAFAALIKDAEKTRNFGALCDCVAGVEVLRDYCRVRAFRLSEKIELGNSIGEYVELALEEDTPLVMRELLSFLPDATAAELTKRFTAATRRSEAERIKNLAEALGIRIVEALTRSIHYAQLNVSVIGLLGSLRYEVIATRLPDRLGELSCSEQAQVVSQLARLTNGRGGDLLLALLDRFHPWIVPLALDEIVLGEQSDAGPLLELVEGRGLAMANPYVQLKAIEAAGRMQLQAAVEPLREIVRARTLLNWRYAQEIRIVAMQAIQRIDPHFDRSVTGKLGFSREDLQLAPLRLNGGQWVRHRRYPRVPLDNVTAMITSSGGCAANAVINVMSLKGGFGELTNAPEYSGEATVEIPSGLRRLRFQAVLAPRGDSSIAFEIGSIDLDTRLRLRKFLTAHAS